STYSSYVPFAAAWNVTSEGAPSSKTRRKYTGHPEGAFLSAIGTFHTTSADGSGQPGGGIIGKAKTGPVSGLEHSWPASPSARTVQSTTGRPTTPKTLEERLT